MGEVIALDNLFFPCLFHCLPFSGGQYHRLPYSQLDDAMPAIKGLLWFSIACDGLWDDAMHRHLAEPLGQETTSCDRFSPAIESEIHFFIG